MLFVRLTKGMSRQEELPAVPEAAPAFGEQSSSAGALLPQDSPASSPWQPFPGGGWSVKAVGEPWVGQVA